MKYILLLVLLICGNSIYAQVFETKLILGADPDKPIEYSFGKIVDFKVGPNGNLYVADQLSNNIKVFDQEGSFKYIIGRRGRGPGEFIQLQNIFFNSSGNLFATDPMQFTVTEFNLNGDVVNTYLTPKESQALNFFKYVFSFENEFIAIYKQWGFGRWAQYDKDEIIHVWDSYFSKIKESFGTYEGFGYDNTFAEVYVRSKLGSVEMLDQSTILIAPHIYTGNLHLYKNKSGSWVEQDKIVTKHYNLNYYTSRTSNDNSKDIIEINTSDRGKMYGKINILSAGIFKYKDGIIYFNLIKQDIGNVYDLEAQIFDSNFKLIDDFVVKRFSSEQNPSMTRPLVIENDREGNFYMIYKTRSVGEVIEKFTLTE